MVSEDSVHDKNIMVEGHALLMVSKKQRRRTVPERKGQGTRHRLQCRAYVNYLKKPRNVLY